MIKDAKSRIVLIIKRLFHYLGFIVERIPDANRLFDQSNDVHREVQKFKLKKLVSNIRIANNQKLYNNIMKKYVVDWNNNFSSAEFVGKGIGAHNFCVYRKVCFENKYYFEKVYFNDSYDLLKTEWFYEHVYSVLKDYVNTPKLYKIMKGDLITIVYFEFIDFVPLPREVWHSVFFNVSRRMFKLSKDIEELSNNASRFLKDYTLHDYYIISIKVGKKKILELSNNRITLEMIEQIINLQPLIFTHGDIHDRNVFAGNYIIDWDSIGFFPLGFESAIIFANNPESLTLKDLQEILIKEYNEVINKDQWEGFELSCLYFYLLFTAKDEESIANSILQRDVFNRIENLYYKNIQLLG